MAASADIVQRKLGTSTKNMQEKLENSPSAGRNVREDRSSRSFCVLGKNKK